MGEISIRVLICIGVISCCFSAYVKPAVKDPYHPVEEWEEWIMSRQEDAYDDEGPTELPPLAIPPKGAEEWRRMAQEALDNALDREELNRNVAKNVIIFIGDGMGITTTTAARLLLGEERDPEGFGEEGYLSFEKFPHMALSKTYNADWQTGDSAGGATAILCGIKSLFSTIALDDTAVHQVCESQEWSAVDSITYWAEEQGMATGVVTNTAVTHATPAAAYAQAASRVWESDSDMPSEGPDGRRVNCSDIAMQLIERGHDIEVVMGGGRSNFLGQNTPDPVDPGQFGNRNDERNLIQEWEEDKENKGAGHAVVYNTDELEAVDVDETDYLFGLFTRGHMSYDRERPAEQPALMDMVETAIRILQKNDDGYFLMVEGGRIDMGHHAGRAQRALTDTIAFSDAVERAVNITDEDDTLIIVTADHSHVMALAGYNIKGSPILGKAISRAIDLMPYTPLVYGNGPGYQEEGREDLTDVNTTDNSYIYQSAVPMGSETHGGEDVGIHARGPMAHLIQGVQEQHYIAHVAGYAACIGENQKHCDERKSCEQLPVRYQKRLERCGYGKDAAAAAAGSTTGDASSVHDLSSTVVLVLAAWAIVKEIWNRN